MKNGGHAPLIVYLYPSIHTEERNDHNAWRQLTIVHDMDGGAGRDSATGRMVAGEISGHRRAELE